MSLINDALRQASQTHKQQTGAPASSGAATPPPLPQPVEEPAPLSPWPSLIKLVAVIVLGVALLACAGVFLHRAWLSHRSQTVAKSGTQTASAPVNATASNRSPTKVLSQPLPPTASAQAGKSPLSTGAAQNVATVPESKPAPPAAPPVAASQEPKPVAVAPPAVKWPALRLQGIFFRPPDSSVVINNKTLYTGDDFQGIKVAQIERDRVTLSLNGQTNSLFLR
jgi:hypothetical protein